MENKSCLDFKEEFKFEAVSSFVVCLMMSDAVEATAALLQQLRNNVAFTVNNTFLER